MAIYQNLIAGSGFLQGPVGPTGPAANTNIITYEYIATQGQTTFTGVDANLQTLAYTPTGIIITLNGSVLNDVTDFTATDGTSIVLNQAANAGDELMAYTFPAFNVANTYTQAQTNSLFLAKTGGTITGNVNFSGAGVLLVPQGNTAQRPANTAGLIRYNTDLNTLESANGTAWANVGSGGVSSNLTSLTGNVYITSAGGLIDASQSNGALVLPTGNTVQRPATANGSIRWNTSNNAIEAFTNNNWTSIFPLANNIIQRQNIGFTQSYAQTTQVATTVNSSTPTTIAQVTITTYGYPVLLLACGDMNPGSPGDWNWFAVWKGASQLTPNWIGQSAGGSYNLPFSYVFIDTPAAGTYTYYLKAWQGTGTMTYGETGAAQGPNLIALEMV